MDKRAGNADRFHSNVTDTSPVLARAVAREIPSLQLRPPSRGEVGLLGASVVRIVLGVLFLTVSVFAAADIVDRVTGDIKVAVQKPLHQIVSPGQLSVIREQKARASQSSR